MTPETKNIELAKAVSGFMTMRDPRETRVNLQDIMFDWLQGEYCREYAAKCLFTFQSLIELMDNLEELDTEQ